VSFLFSITENNAQVDLINPTINGTEYLHYLGTNVKSFKAPKLDDKKFEAITITKLEFQSLVALVDNLTEDQQFLEGTRIYFSVREVSFNSKPNYVSHKVELVLKGLKKASAESEVIIEEKIIPTGIFINGLLYKR